MVLYMDNNATTHMESETIQTIVSNFNHINPGSRCTLATPLRDSIADFRKAVVSACRLVSEEWNIIITSGASESNCAMLNSMMYIAKNPFFLISPLEHKSILLWASKMREFGRIDYSMLKITMDGCIDLQDLEAQCQTLHQRDIIVCIQYANNDVGIVNRVKEIYKICKKNKAFFFTDATQVLGKHERLRLSMCDAFSLSLHKVYGPVGVGVLAIRREIDFVPLVFGSQQNGRRGGTENVALITGATRALAAVPKLDVCKMRELRSIFIDKIAQQEAVYLLDVFRGMLLDPSSIPRRCVVIVETLYPDETLANTLCMGLYCRGTEVKGSKIVDALCGVGVCASVGSACQSFENGINHVHEAMGIPKCILHSIIRISLCDTTTLQDVCLGADEVVRVFRFATA